MAPLRPYCPACLDKWAQPTVWDPIAKIWRARPRMHDNCRKALEALQ